MDHTRRSRNSRRQEARHPLPSCPEGRNLQSRPSHQINHCVVVTSTSPNRGDRHIALCSWSLESRPRPESENQRGRFRRATSTSPAATAKPVAVSAQIARARTADLNDAASRGTPLTSIRNGVTSLPPRTGTCLVGPSPTVTAQSACSNRRGQTMSTTAATRPANANLSTARSFTLLTVTQIVRSGLISLSSLSTQERHVGVRAKRRGS